MAIKRAKIIYRLNSTITYLRLCRIDGALIAFFSYLVGAELAGGPDLNDIIIALAVTLISTNFIYSFNSWTDWHIDKINKPDRPIPSGEIRPKNAFIYSLVLLILSVAYPFLVFESYFTLFLLLILPVLGLLYSAKPFRLRRYPAPAIITICLGLITPIMLGYFSNTSDISLVPFFIVLFLYCLSVVPLKEIEEVEEDARGGYQNLFSIFGERLLVFSICGLFADILLVFLLNFSYILKAYLLIFTISSMVCISVFVIFRRKLDKLYQTIIYLVIIEGIVLLLFFLNAR